MIPTYPEIEKDYSRLQHIMEEIDDIEAFMEERTRDRKTAKAIERSIMTIGEACRQLSHTLKEHYPDIPWSDVIGMRHILVHEYYRVDAETVWNVAEHKIPALREAIERVLEDLAKAQS